MRALLFLLLAWSSLACAATRPENAISLRVAGFVQAEGIT